MVATTAQKMIELEQVYSNGPTPNGRYTRQAAVTGVKAGQAIEATKPHIDTMNSMNSIVTLRGPTS